MATTCFVIMPFDPELHYLYLYMKQHLEEKFDIHCERGDSKILTVPLLDKIRQYIQDADFLIADCSGRNLGSSLYNYLSVLFSSCNREKPFLYIELSGD